MEEITEETTVNSESDCTACKSGKIAGIACLVIAGIFFLIGMDFLLIGRGDNDD